MKDEDNYKLAQVATKHYDRATEAEFKNLRAEDIPPQQGQPQVRTLEFGNPYVAGPRGEGSPTKLNIKKPGNGQKKDKPSGGGLTEMPGIPS